MASTARTKVIVTDGVFSMDGTVAQLDAICALAEKHQALVFVEEPMAGVPMKFLMLWGKWMQTTGTLGKALGEAVADLLLEKGNY